MWYTRINRYIVNNIHSKNIKFSVNIESILYNSLYYMYIYIYMVIKLEKGYISPNPGYYSI